MTNPNIKIVDVSNDSTIERQMTNKEFSDWEKLQSLQNKQQIIEESLKKSALDKLAALGLTPEEIAAITGGN